MATAFRLVVAFAVVLLTGGAAVAQPPTAPPPHPALDELVKEYRRLGLPLVPPDAELVRINWYRYAEPEDEPPAEPYVLAFRFPPAKPGDPVRYLRGGLFPEEYVVPASVEVARPTPDALRLVRDSTLGYLCLAVQCKSRGWDELAAALYDCGRRQADEETNGAEWGKPLVRLRGVAWWYWEDRLTRRDSDRQELLRRLKLLWEDEPGRRGMPDELLRSLELTLAPRKSKPGTVEALVDDLTDYWLDPKDPSNTAGQEAYWKLVELGFDAVPALVDHVRDDRLTRAYDLHIHSPLRYHLTIGRLASRLLYDLSAGTIGGEYWARGGGRLDPAKAREWWAAAQKVGEEKWLLDHAVPADDAAWDSIQVGPPEALIVRVVGAKYPAHLPAIYRAMLKKSHTWRERDFVAEIVASKLPRGQKVALFEEGAAHDDRDPRAYALEGLAALDRPLLRKHLLRTLKEAHERLDAYQPTQLVPLIVAADDPECWDALAELARDVTFGLRAPLIEVVGEVTPPDRPDPARRERVRFLAQFLDDRTADPGKGERRDPLEVGDHAADLLAGLLGLPMRRTTHYTVFHDPTRGPLSRLLLREVVRQLAERELAGKK